MALQVQSRAVGAIQLSDRVSYRELLNRLGLPWPSKIVGIGLNYRDHAAESNMEVPTHPLVFAKWPNTLIGDGDPIRLPAGAGSVDYEAELGAVIGTSVRGPIAVERALDVVAGYTCVNDVSERDTQLGDGQWTRGKSFDTFCPVGPVVVPAAEIADPQSLRIRCLVDEEVMQDATTGDMLFSVAEIIAFLSGSIALEPGDLIATGTPPGVGLGRTPPRYLRAGEVVKVDIEGIGTLTNPVVPWA
jgi:2-keto-4-pentenoate hydratase/2-oxohepta-3-ene-1,7-dioic acid hydratase in catechol pathway